MGHPDVNKYRSGKNPHRQVLVSSLEDGRYVAHVIDWAHGHFVRLESPAVDQGESHSTQEGIE